MPLQRIDAAQSDAEPVGLLTQGTIGYGTEVQIRHVNTRKLLSVSMASVYLSPAYVEEQNSWLEIRR